jgi:hypothetical protein
MVVVIVLIEETEIPEPSGLSDCSAYSYWLRMMLSLTADEVNELGKPSKEIYIVIFDVIEIARRTYLFLLFCWASTAALPKTQAKHPNN